MTLVSVVVPIYNHEEFVEQAILSIVGQSYPDIEIVCVDDGSRDGSADVAQGVLQGVSTASRFVTQENQGAHVALNRGASLASGDLLMFLNSDDLYHPERVRSFVELWQHQGSPATFWGFSSTFFIGDGGEPVDPEALGVGHLSQNTGWVRRQMWIDELFAWHNVMLTSGNLVVPRLLFEQVGGFVGHRMVHDWDMALRLLLIAPPVVITDELYGYRLHGSNTFRSIATDDAVKESAEVRSLFEQGVADRVRTEPYSHRGIPFVDYLRLAVPMNVGTTGG